MQLTKCSRETEVRALLRQGHWPAASPAELREHVAACQGCLEVVTLTLGFQQARQTSMTSARMMPSGLIWWRAQLRRRQQALEQASRPIRWAQVFGMGVSLFASVAVVGWVAGTGEGVPWFRSLAAFGGSIRSVAAGLTVPLMAGIGVLALVGAWALWDSRTS